MSSKCSILKSNALIDVKSSQALNIKSLFNTVLAPVVFFFFFFFFSVKPLFLLTIAFSAYSFGKISKARFRFIFSPRQGIIEGRNDYSQPSVKTSQ